MTMMDTPNPNQPTAMEISASPPAGAEAIDHVIEYAWHRCNAFDDRSGDLKKRYRRIRESIIMITWFTTLLAVLSALSSFDNVISLLQFGALIVPLGFIILTTPYHEMKNFGLPTVARTVWQNIRQRFRFIVGIVVAFLVAMAAIWVMRWVIPADVDRTIFKLTLIILPLTSTALLGFAGRFEAGNAWVGFREAAESIRRKIYETRVLAGQRQLTEADLEALRTLVVDQGSKLDEMGITTPVWGMPYEPGSAGTVGVAPLWTDDPADNGYAPLTIDQYVCWRLVHQTNYYRGRIRKDWNKTREFRALIFFVGGLGAFLAAADYGHFVAVTVAGVAALQAWLSLREHEVSYGIHQRTLKQLEDRIASYYIMLKKIGDKPVKTDADQQSIMSFVDSVEDILDDERAAWQAAVLQRQEATESALTQLVTAGKPDDWKLEQDEDGYLRVVVSETQTETQKDADGETSTAHTTSVVAEVRAPLVAEAAPAQAEEMPPAIIEGAVVSAVSEAASPNGAYEAQTVDFDDDEDDNGYLHAMSEVGTLEAQTVDFDDDEDDDYSHALSEVDTLEAQTVDFDNDEDDDYSHALSEVAGEADGDVDVVGANGSANGTAVAESATEDEELVAPG